jgi:hypothetical protein
MAETNNKMGKLTEQEVGDNTYYSSHVPKLM